MIFYQDDSMMNRKVMAKIIESSSSSGRGDRSHPILPQHRQVCLLEADDGVTAVEFLRSEMAAGRTVDMVLMDFVMVCDECSVAVL